MLIQVRSCDSSSGHVMVVLVMLHASEVDSSLCHVTAVFITCTIHNYSPLFSWDPFLHWEFLATGEFTVGQSDGQRWFRHQEECYWTQDRGHLALHQPRGPHHDSLQGSGVCLRPRYSRTHHLWLQRYGDDGVCKSVMCWSCDVWILVIVIMCESKSVMWYVWATHVMVMWCGLVSAVFKEHWWLFLLKWYDSSELQTAKATPLITGGGTAEYCSGAPQ